jgi:hypothetical protein
MGSRAGMIVSGGLALMLLTAIGLRLAWINQLGGVPNATIVEPLLQALHEARGDLPAREALVRLGTNAMPTITNYLGFRESDLRAKLRAFASSRPWLKFRVFGETDYREMALEGARLQKEIAGPFLVAMFAGAPLRYEDDSPARHADRVLGVLGADAVPALDGGLLSADAGVRGHCALAIANHSNLRDGRLVPNLVRCARDRNSRVRAAAMLALGRVLEQAELSVPALALGLSDEESAVRFHAAHSLWAFGSEAKAALPALKEAAAMEAGRIDAGFDQQPLGPKSREMICYALTNAYSTILEHGD